MKAITLRNLPPNLDKAIRKRARAKRMSVNKAVIGLLEEHLTQDKTIRFSWLYPLQWPTTLRLLDAQKIDTGPIITHTASLDGIGAAIERVLEREDEVVKTVIRP